MPSAPSVAQVDSFVRCRSFGHAWEEEGPTFESNAPVWKFKLQLRCMRCGMVRKDAVDAYGDLAYRSYDAPEGYAYAEGERPTAQQFRLMLFETRSQRRLSSQLRSA